MSEPTKSQQLAIAARGNVLVSAGAGTGKTSTLVERCIRLVLDEGLSLERILMVTFTEAAAAEMRLRLREALQQKLDEPGAPANRVTQQLALLDTAHISTLHGFCLRLVREHFHELEIDPDVQVLDDEQTRPLISDTLDQLLERHYAAGTTSSLAVHELVRRLGRGSDASVRELVVQLHRFTQTLPDPRQWLDQQVAAFGEAQPDRWRAFFVEAASEWRNLWLDALTPHLENVNVKAAAAAVHRMPEKLAFDDAANALRAVTVADGNEAGWRKVKGKHRGPIARFFDDAALLLSLVEPADGTNPLQQDWDWTRPHMLTLLRLAREFTDAFTRAKRELAGVDFADQEQLSLRLLRDAHGLPTPTALHWRAQLDHVFVDECQDINAAQDAILCALSRDGADANRFLVGDVKQSIYRFRLAEPAIFAGYENAWRQPGAGAQRIPLSDNFRSHESLLGFVNAFFAPLLRERVGGISYGRDAALQFAKPEVRAALSLVAGAAPRVELHVLPHKLDGVNDTDGDGAEESFDELAEVPAAQREARLVARRLTELRAGKLQVCDKAEGKFRDVAWRDMVVLLRAPGGKVETYAQEFHAAGVPLVAERGGFWAAQEVVDLVSLLRVLDNPHQDIPLLAVLRSPLVAMTLGELVEVRAQRTNGALWEAVKKCSVFSVQCSDSEKATGEGAGEVTHHAPRTTQVSAQQKAKWFCDRVASWRQLLRHASLTDCLETVLTETHFEPLTLSGNRGPERVANVFRLLDLARQFDPWQRQGLFRFLRFVDAQLDEDVDREPAPPSAHDAVQLMSIHQSKGLEFPVVVLADLGKQFNRDSARRDVLLNAALGVCPKVTPHGVEQGYASTAWWLANAREEREGLGEELRLLYVAFTRARDRLLLTGTLPRMKAENVELLRIHEPRMDVSDREVLAASRPLDWMLLWLRRHATNAEGLGDPAGSNALLGWRWHDETSLAGPPIPATAHDEARAASEQPSGAMEQEASQFAMLRGRLTWRYGFEAATHEPAKTSVSALRRRAAEADADAREWPRGELFGFQRSVFSGEARSGILKLSATERGTAHHAFQQHVALEQTGSVAGMRAEAERLVREDTLTLEQAAALDFPAIAAFWNSDVGQRILANRARVKRELEFTARLSPADLARFPTLAPKSPLDAREFVVVQGKVDLLVMLDDEMWLLDFKTDRFAPDELQAKTGEHSAQLGLYALALGRIHGRTVTTKWLHFFHTGQTLAV